MFFQDVQGTTTDMMLLRMGALLLMIFTLLTTQWKYFQPGKIPSFTHETHLHGEQWACIWECGRGTVAPWRKLRCYVLCNHNTCPPIVQTPKQWQKRANMITDGVSDQQQQKMVLNAKMCTKVTKSCDQIHPGVANLSPFLWPMETSVSIPILRTDCCLSHSVV